MRRIVLFCIAGWLILAASPALAQPPPVDDAAKILSAMSAAPSSVSRTATISDWPAEPGGLLRVLRPGSDEWTCLPDRPETDLTDPMCLDPMFLTWADAWLNRKPLVVTRMGFGYMLQGGSQESNTDPAATGPTPDNEWMPNGVPHLMIVVPNTKTFAGLSTDPENGGPWVMWRDTPYELVMVPMPRNLSKGK
jgi:hypothetical protein